MTQMRTPCPECTTQSNFLLSLRFFFLLFLIKSLQPSECDHKLTNTKNIRTRISVLFLCAKFCCSHRSTTKPCANTGRFQPCEQISFFCQFFVYFFFVSQKKTNTSTFLGGAGNARRGKTRQTNVRGHLKATQHNRLVRVDIRLLQPYLLHPSTPHPQPHFLPQH